MKNGVLIAAACAVGMIVTTPASAATLLDDFNRPSNQPLGTSWTQQVGSSSIQGNAATGTNLSLATFNGAAAQSVTFDIQNIGNSVQYIAAVLGYGSGPNLFIKVQNNGSGTNFDRYGFYTGNNNSGPGTLFGTLSSPFKQASVTASFVNNMATLSITPQNEAVQTYNFAYNFTPTGTGVGLGFFGDARADNFSADLAASAIPEPATWAMMIMGFGLIGGAMRYRTRSAKVSFA